jgi:predicted unusual protein kinase regulating ubiquinone biosynthesis (AarF/ABC1/UbiB family)
MLRTRYRKIVFYAARVIWELIFYDVILARIGFRKRVTASRVERLRRIAADYRALAVEMGGLLIKVGQFLSTRADVLPPVVIDELAQMQDEVPPEAFEAIRQVVEAELDCPLDTCFVEFDPTSLAAASLGQVHRARLWLSQDQPSEGEEAKRLTPVVVKVQRPGIEDIVNTDLAAIRTIGKWLKRYPAIRRHADVPALIAEFTRIVLEEVDYIAEGRNAEIFAENFADRPDVRIPYIVWSHTTQRVLTMEDVYAIKVTDYEAITAAGVDRVEVSQRLIDVYYQQIFEDGFFHADPHPGNLFVAPTSASSSKRKLCPLSKAPPSAGQDWQLTFVDFGMAERVPASLRAGLREMVIALGTKDAHRLVLAYQQLNMLLPGTDLRTLEVAHEQVLERFWGLSMTELLEIDLDEMRAFAQENRELFYEMPFQLPQNLIFLFRTLGILSGLCTSLDPDLNLWESFVPYAERIMAEEVSTNWRIWLQEVGESGKAVLVLPKHLDSVLIKADHLLEEVEAGRLLELFFPSLEPLFGRLEFAIHRLVTALVVTAMFLGGSYLYAQGEKGMGHFLIVGAILTQAWVLVHRMMRARRKRNI